MLWLLITVFSLSLTVVLAALGALAVKALLRGEGEVTGLATGVTWLLVTLSCLLTLDKRLTQARRDGLDVEQLPTGWPTKFANALSWIYYPLFVVLAVLDWRWAVGLYVTLFVLAVLPVSEIVGNLLWGQILWRGTRGFQERR